MELNSLWPTIIGSGKFEIDGLLEHLFTSYDIHSFTKQNGETLFNDKSRVMKKFKELVYKKFDEYLMSTIGKSIKDYGSYEMRAWVTGGGQNYRMTSHNHSGSQLSAVFYIMSEEENSGGEIVFTDPRLNSNRGYDDWFHPMFSNHVHSPKTGDYMIFPSFLYHHVNQYYSNVRICVPVDLYLHRSKYINRLT